MSVKRGREPLGGEGFRLVGWKEGMGKGVPCRFSVSSLYWYSCRSGSRLVRGGGVRVKQLLPIAVVKTGERCPCPCFPRSLSPCTMTFIPASFSHAIAPSSTVVRSLCTNLSRREKISPLESLHTYRYACLCEPSICGKNALHKRRGIKKRIKNI